MLRKKFISGNTYLKKEENLQVNNLQVKELEKKKTEPKASRKGEISKIRADINKMETKKTVEKIN